MAHPLRSNCEHFYTLAKEYLAIGVYLMKLIFLKSTEKNY
jgi:hypothetical protein